MGGGGKAGTGEGRNAGSFGVRVFLLVGALALCALIAAAGIGYDLIRRGDEAALALQRRLLQTALAQLAKDDPVDARAAELVRQTAPLPGLDFETGPAGEGREQQPLTDGRGRIAGFLTWDAPRSQRLFDPAVIMIAAGYAGLLLFAGVTLWQLRRARRKLVHAEELVAQTAEADRLTGLPNQNKIPELLDQALKERATDEAVIFALIEIDGLDEAHAGPLGVDELVVMIAQRLRDVLPDHAACGRIGVSQFAIVSRIGPREDAHTGLRSVLDKMAEPYWMDKVVRVAPQAGFAMAPLHGAGRNELARRAELALRSAIRKGPGSLVMFDFAIDQASAEQKFVQRELPRALAAQELEVHYQPIVSAAGGAVVGFEALLRWTHAERGAIPPATFVPIAEQMGLMDQIGAYVVRRALNDSKRWPDLYVAVNLSPMQVRHPGLIETVRAALADAAVPASRLILEITEGVLIDNPEEMVHRIGELHALGVRVALDDFGAGYSNLGYLQRFPLDKLKIDKSFVDALATTEKGAVILQAIVGLGRALGLLVTAEGVETEQQRVLLRLAGCDEMQGYLFGKAMPAKEVDLFLRRAMLPKGAALTA